MNSKTAEALLKAAEERFNELVDEGVDPDTAADRVWRCYERAYGEQTTDKPEANDKLLEVRLNKIIEKGKDHA